MEPDGSGHEEHEEPEELHRSFQAWIERRLAGRAESLAELLDKHPGLAEELSLGQPDQAPDDDMALGDFRLVREVGRGGMGIVYAAEQRSLGRSVALKILPAQLTLNPQALARFKREAEITAGLKHPCIIDIHAVGEAEGIHFMAMELIDGVSLDRFIERMQGESGRERADGGSEIVSIHGLESGKPTREASKARPRSGSSSASNKGYIESSVRIIVQVAEALSAAHAAGVIHRDVKPANILMREDGSAVLTDFGLAKAEAHQGFSVTGQFAGTPYYVSPEQAMSGRVRVDHRTDVYSLGVTLYELLTLERPFEGNYQAVLGQIVSREPVRPDRLNSALAPDLVTIILKAMEKDVERRYASATAFAADLRAFIEYRPIEARRTGAPTRAIRWVRRQPARAALVATLTLGVPLVGWLWREVARSRDAAAVEQTLDEWTTEGFLALTESNSSRAGQVFDSVLSRRPMDVSATVGRVLVHFQQGDFDVAIAAVESLSGWRERPGLLRLHAEALRSLGRSVEAAASEGLAAEVDGQELIALDLTTEALLLLRQSPVNIMRVDAGSDTAEVVYVRENVETAEHARQLLEQASLMEPNPLNRFALAWACWVTQNRSASAIAKTLQREYADLPAAWHFAGLALEVVDLEEALGSYRTALDLDPTQQASEDRHNVLLTRVGERLELGPVTLFERYVERSPESAAAHANLAAVLWGHGMFERALEEASEALAIEPALVQALDTQGNALVSLGRYAEACSIYRRALEVDPERAVCMADLGLALTHCGEHKEAIAVLSKAIELAPGLPEARCNMALVLVELGREREALDFIEQAVALDESDPFLWKQLGLCHENLEQPERALVAYRRALALNDTDVPLMQRFGAVLSSMGRYVESAEAYSRALEVNPDGPRITHALALMSAGNMDECIGTLREWARRRPDDPEALNNLAYFLAASFTPESLRDPEGALEAAKRANELGSLNYLYLDTLALAYARIGEFRAATATSERAINAYLAAESAPADDEAHLRASLAAYRDQRVP